MNDNPNEISLFSLLGTHCPFCGQPVLQTMLYYPEDETGEPLYESEPRCLACATIPPEEQL